MEKFLKRAWVEINLDHLKHNVKRIKQNLHDQTELMAIVKANAYGHGDEMISKELEGLGVKYFGVSNIEEAMVLRRAGIKGEILILGITPPEFCRELCENKITQTVFSLEYAKKLNETLEKDGLTADVHIKLDTGMGRIGFFAEHQICEQAAKEISCLKSLHVTGVFSHFSHADCFSEDAKEYTNRQIKAFDECVKTIREYFPNIRTHLQNSAGIVDYNSLCYDIARPGIILYGLSPSGEMVNDIGLNPVMQMKSIVSMVKEVPAGTAVSYSRRFVSDKVMTVATVSVGYADGYSRLLSNRAEVLVKGKRAKVLGTVCMDQIIIDVTDIDGVAQGDIVTLFGKDGEQEISLDELANIIGTINYEIVCLMSKRVPRIYYKNNEIVATVDYIMS